MPRTIWFGAFDIGVADYRLRAGALRAGAFLAAARLAGAFFAAAFFAGAFLATAFFAGAFFAAATVPPVHLPRSHTEDCVSTMTGFCAKLTLQGSVRAARVAHSRINRVRLKVLKLNRAVVRDDRVRLVAALMSASET